MLKKFVFSVMICCLFLAGCSGGSKKTGEDIQKKIDESGWKLEEPKGGSLTENVNLVINADESLSATHDKEKDEISDISFINEQIGEKYIIYREGDTGDDLGLIYIGEYKRTCSLYNLTKGKEDTHEENSNKECSEQNVNKLKELIKTRDEILKQQDLNVDDLFTWSKWYYNIK